MITIPKEDWWLIESVASGKGELVLSAENGRLRIGGMDSSRSYAWFRDYPANDNFKATLRFKRYYKRKLKEALRKGISLDSIPGAVEGDNKNFNLLKIPEIFQNSDVLKIYHIDTSKVQRVIQDMDKDRALYFVSDGEKVYSVSFTDDDEPVVGDVVGFVEKDMELYESGVAEPVGMGVGVISDVVSKYAGDSFTITYARGRRIAIDGKVRIYTVGIEANFRTLLKEATLELHHNKNLDPRVKTITRRGEPITMLELYTDTIFALRHLNCETSSFYLCEYPEYLREAERFFREKYETWVLKDEHDFDTYLSIVREFYSVLDSFKEFVAEHQF